MKIVDGALAVLVCVSSGVRKSKLRQKRRRQVANTNIRRWHPHRSLKTQTQAAGTFHHFKTQTLTEQDLLLFIN